MAMAMAMARTMSALRRHLLLNRCPRFPTSSTLFKPTPTPAPPPPLAPLSALRPAPYEALAARPQKTDPRTPEFDLFSELSGSGAVMDLRSQATVMNAGARLDAEPSQSDALDDFADFADAGEAELRSQQQMAMDDRDCQSNNRLKVLQLQPGDELIPIKAFYVSRSVALKGLIDEEVLEVISYSRNNIFAKFKDRANGPSSYGDKRVWPAMNSWCAGPFMVVFHYGSVVLLNCGKHEEEEFLNLVKKYCPDNKEEARKDDYKVVVRPTLETWSQGGHDTIFLRKLDIDNVRVISSILGQSVALEHHLKKADELVNMFSHLNHTMEVTGTFNMSRKTLFQLVAAANNTLADLVLRVCFLERSESAWRNARYASIWEYLRGEFEMLDRFENCNFKLKTTKKNLVFFLEVLQNKKSDFMEWIIIILISFELFISTYFIVWNNFVVVA